MPSEKNTETLKDILQNCLHPEVLDSHPWTNSLIVRNALLNTPALQKKSPGQQLVITIAEYFAQLMPATAPQRNKKTDASWNGFGALAAQYFAPLLFGAPAPASPREAYEKIDESVLFFVFGKTNVQKEERDAYRLTRSDGDFDAAFEEWHKRGLEQLSTALAEGELRFADLQQTTAVIPIERKRKRNAPSSSIPAKNEHTGARWAAALGFLLAVVLLAAFAFFKAQKAGEMLRGTREDARYLQSLLAEPEGRQGRLKNIGSALSILRADVTALKEETQPFFWAGPFLGWVPTHGGDLAAVEDLSTLAETLLSAAEQSYQVFAPLVDEGSLTSVNPTELTAFLQENQPQLMRAQQLLEQAQKARSRLKLEKLSPEVRTLILEGADPAMQALQDGLTLAVELPVIMGASSKGSQTYLLLVQNEDELRPTGGFITAASTVRMADGKIDDLNFVNSSELDNWHKIYPAAPWQLKEYMNSPVLVFRDSNWFTHYPTTALYARYLYSFANDRTVNGVIAFDQHLLVEVLQVTGPIQLEDVSYPITAENIIQYMRESKTPDARQADSTNWNNKAFLNNITYALLQKILSGEVQWEQVSTMLLRALNERHLLLQVDNPAITALLEHNGWDGAVNPGTADFLMAVDTNIGFNKTNAEVSSSLTYDVNLTDLSAPVGILTVAHTNHVTTNMICKHWLKNRIEGEKDYPIADCYWNYLRVYKPAETMLLSATPQVVPDIWMINKQKKTGQVDILSEDIPGAQAFGTLQVVPTGESLAVNFEFALPAKTLRFENGKIIYTLRVQKQPGTIATPFTLRVQIPANTVVESTSPSALVQDRSILYETDLRTDLEFSIVFTAP